MPVPQSVLLVELVMSADRLVEAARAADGRDPGDGEWDAATILRHLGEVDDAVWGPRLDSMLTARRDGRPAPATDWWEPDADATRARWLGTSVDDAAAALMASRTRLIGRCRGLDAADWSATLSHGTFGELDVEGVLVRVLEHDEVHRASLLLPRP